jgi:hypothetical protein
MHVCAYPGATVRVSYHSFKLASAAAPKFCEERGTRTVIARGRVSLPGSALENLAADVRAAADAFHVTITIPYWQDGARQDLHVLTVSCIKRRVGEAVDGVALCDVRDVRRARSQHTELTCVCRCNM